MSHHGIGLVFSFGPGGRPEVVVIGDLLLHCEVCGYESGVRRYLPAPFHTLTTRALELLLPTIADGVEGPCPQCAEPLTTGAVVASLLHYGFPSGKGVIRGFRQGNRTSWLLCPHDGIDVQEVPDWSPSVDASRVEAERLDETVISEAFGRCLSAKAQSRSWINGGERGVLRCGPGLALVTGCASEEEAIAAASENTVTPGPWIAVDLAPDGALDGFYGAPAGWLAGLQLSGDGLWGCAALSGLQEVVESIVSGFPIEVGIARDADTLAMILPDSDSGSPRPLLALGEIAYEAARSMSFPGDIARLEIDRILHGLTGLWEA